MLPLQCRNPRSQCRRVNAKGATEPRCAEASGSNLVVEERRARLCHASDVFDREVHLPARRDVHWCRVWFHENPLSICPAMLEINPWVSWDKGSAITTDEPLRYTSVGLRIRARPVHLRSSTGRSCSGRFPVECLCRPVAHAHGPIDVTVVSASS